ncbi:hypothetical protein Fmac_022849 [Flemingia macrophylla]|uniref:Uncharacterized protein n=1 Tax=Flemingia macrophylla TaxID=520843 RepID=A0ABD1LJX7_9FABA
MLGLDSSFGCRPLGCRARTPALAPKPTPLHPTYPDLSVGVSLQVPPPFGGDYSERRRRGSKKGEEGSAAENGSRRLSVPALQVYMITALKSGQLPEDLKCLNDAIMLHNVDEKQEDAVHDDKVEADGESNNKQEQINTDFVSMEQSHIIDMDFTSQKISLTR